MASVDIQQSLSQTLQDDTLPAPKEALEAAFTTMSQGTSTHLVASVARFLTVADDLDSVAPLVLPHLSQCSRCRLMVWEMLHRNGVPDSHPAYALLEDAEEGARWDAAGRNAAESAYAMLQSHGIGHVYGREGTVYRRRADGTEETIRLSDAQDAA